jgi:hypothetical protein
MRPDPQGHRHSSQRLDTRAGRKMPSVLWQNRHSSADCRIEGDAEGGLRGART